MNLFTEYKSPSLLVLQIPAKASNACRPVARGKSYTCVCVLNNPGDPEPVQIHVSDPTGIRIIIVRDIAPQLVTLKYISFCA